MKTTRIMRRLGRGVLLALLLTVVFRAEAESQTPAAAAQPPEASPEQPFVTSIEDATWGPPGNAPRFPQGVRTAQLGTDPDNDGPIYYALFPAGSHFDLHWHTYSEYVVVVSGNVTIVLGEETHELSVGSYVVIPGRMNHSWDVPTGGEDAVILVRRSGPADFTFVDR
jgi:quercetin dioxygenase-like cupin family protein